MLEPHACHFAVYLTSSYIAMKVATVHVKCEIQVR